MFEVPKKIIKPLNKYLYLPFSYKFDHFITKPNNIYLFSINCFICLYYRLMINVIIFRLLNGMNLDNKKICKSLFPFQI